jgi:hypothetical protein
MHPKDLINRALIAASVAESDGYTATSVAFRELAEGLIWDLMCEANVNKPETTRRGHRDDASFLLSGPSCYSPLDH